MMLTGSLALLGFAITCGLTLVVRRYALATKLLDLPNARSSHSVPTPRGGGVAIVASLLLFVVLVGTMGVIEGRLVACVLGAGVTVAVLGFLDDRSGLSARWRFLGHAVAAIWAIYWIGRIPPMPVFGMEVDLSFAGPALCGLYLVWMVNLFNFMDGIDGLASVEAITTTVGGALLWWLAGSGTDWIVALLFASCVGGFLVWNFPPAKIFMGDAGSGFLGLMVGLLSVWCGQATPHLFWAWLVLVGCFMVDATTTLVRRVRRGEKFNEAHRSHAYQYAARKHGSHKIVTVAFGLINLLWLFPIAALVAMKRLDGLAAVAFSYLPLVWLAFRYKAGARHDQEI